MLNGGGCGGNALMGIGGIAAAAAGEEEVVVVSVLGHGWTVDLRGLSKQMSEKKGVL